MGACVSPGQQAASVVAVNRACMAPLCDDHWTQLWYAMGCLIKLLREWPRPVWPVLDRIYLQGHPLVLHVSLLWWLPVLCGWVLMHHTCTHPSGSRASAAARHTWLVCVCGYLPRLYFISTLPQIASAGCRWRHWPVAFSAYYATSSCCYSGDDVALCMHLRR